MPDVRTPDFIEVDMLKVAETERAYGLWDGRSMISERERLLVWVPKTLCQVDDDGTVTMPEWLAMNKGLI